MLMLGKTPSQQAPENQKILSFNCTVGHRSTGSWNRANPWSENHLWVRCRKVFNLIGLIEPRILVSGESPGLTAGEYVKQL